MIRYQSKNRPQSLTLMPDLPPRRFSETLDSLDGILAESWAQLAAATTTAAHGWHLPVVSTIENGHPRGRMVVLRGADAATRTIWFHTDARSSKIAEMQSERQTSWLFYDSESRVQLSLHALATVHTDDEVAQAAWDASRLESLRCYLAPERPGKLSEEPTVNIPQELLKRPPTADEATAGRANFAVVRTEVTSLELLYLKQSGNVRARFTWADDQWVGSWVAP